MKRWKRRAALLLALMLLSSGCGSAPPAPEEPAGSLMEGITARTELPAPDPEAQAEGHAAARDFSAALLRAELAEGENTLLAPLSVFCALAMTANGAAGETRAEMEAVLGLPADRLNPYLRWYMDSLPQGEFHQLQLANALWLTDDSRFTVRPDFLQANADWYGAEIFRTSLDEAACREINAWVSEHTRGMVDGLLDEIPPDAVLYLLNALAFDGKWSEPYAEGQIRPGQFTCRDGQVREAELMWSTESRYLEDEGARGFLKTYQGGRFAFAALLPEGDVWDYAASLTGERLERILSGVRDEPVAAALPRFESARSADLAQTLSDMGMPGAFGPRADFSGMGSSEAGGLFISRVLHRAYLAADERGTRAGAATAVEMKDGGEIPAPQEQVVLDRPFLYLLVDCKTNLPLLMGVLADPGGA